MAHGVHGRFYERQAYWFAAVVLTVGTATIGCGKGACKSGPKRTSTPPAMLQSNNETVRWLTGAAKDRGWPPEMLLEQAGAAGLNTQNVEQAIRSAWTTGGETRNGRI